MMQSRVDGQLLLDPSTEEASREDGSLVLALMPSRNMVSLQSFSLSRWVPDCHSSTVRCQLQMWQ